MLMKPACLGDKASCPPATARPDWKKRQREAEREIETRRKRKRERERERASERGARQREGERHTQSDRQAASALRVSATVPVTAKGL